VNCSHNSLHKECKGHAVHGLRSKLICKFRPAARPLAHVAREGVWAVDDLDRMNTAGRRLGPGRRYQSRRQSRPARYCRWLSKSSCATWALSTPRTCPHGPYQFTSR
jgi:hypothetical protein